MNINRILCIILLLGSFKSFSQQVFTLLSNLEYPRALCLDKGKVYFTETQGALDPFGGRVSLLQYSVSSGQVDTLVHQLICSNTIVVDSAGEIFLGSENGPTIGGQGWVSQYVSSGNADTIVTTVEIATHDMRLNSYGDILLVGMSSIGTAKSIYRFDGGDFTSTPTVLQTGRGLVTSVVQHDSMVYYATVNNINFFGPDGIVYTLNGQKAQSIDYYNGYIYYSDPTGTIGRINTSTRVNTTLIGGLHEPVNLRIDTATESLYFLEAGTSAGQFFDGTLKVMDIGYLSVGIEETSSITSATIYPNPIIDGMLTVTHVPEDTEVTITDVQGRKVLKTQTPASGVIDCSGLSQGSYLLHIYDQKGQSFTQIIHKQ